jgi:transposase, IS30 family
MSRYKRVTAQDRKQIALLSAKGLNQTDIAAKLGFHRSSISRELRRNTGLRGYRPKQAQRKADGRQQWRSEPRKMTADLKGTINKLLGRQWSPEQISRRLELEGHITVSHETIYRYVYTDSRSGGELYQNLRFSHRRRRPRFPRAAKDRRGLIQGATSIERRGAGANNRSRAGHWEMDTMIGGGRQGALLVLADRKNRRIRLGRLVSKQAKRVNKAAGRVLRDEVIRSVTTDRGQEFSAHRALSKKLGVPIYFCHPYTSSERGTVENRIGVLRQYLPKGSRLDNVTDSQLKRIENLINYRPMRCLGWLTPSEVCYGSRVALTM